MADIYIENYKKAVQRAIERWADKVKKPTETLKTIAADLTELEANKDPSDDDKKEIAKLKKDREACTKQLEKAALELKVDLMLLEVDDKANKKEVEKMPSWLPGWVKEIVKKE